MLVETEKENMVQRVIDSASALVSSDQKLKDRRKQNFWSSCTAHYLIQILEDVGDITIFHNTVGKAKRINSFICCHTWVLRNYSNDKVLARPAMKKIAISYLTEKSSLGHLIHVV